MQGAQGGLANREATAAILIETGGPERGPRGSTTEAIAGPTINRLDDGLGFGAAALDCEFGPVASRPGSEQVRGPSLRPSGGEGPAGQLEFRAVAGTRADRGFGQTPDAVGHVAAHQVVDREAVRPDLAARQLGGPAGEIMTLV
jgi:hypothetical protein